MSPAEGLCAFIDASPSPFHVCASVARELETRGFRRLKESDAWPATAGSYFVIRGGSIVAWRVDGAPRAFRIVGGHTDSPNLRVKQHPDMQSGAWQMVRLEPYGGAWLNSWLDRDLGFSGRVVTHDGEKLVRVDEPVLRVPQLAIHLSEDRKGVTLNPQVHLNGIWTGAASFSETLRQLAGGDVLGFELMTHDLAPSRVAGDLVSAPRLDNQGTCFAGLKALLDVQAAEVVPVLALFDHEEVGSTSDRGAESDLLLTVLERIVLANGGSREEFLRTMASSVCASGDMAHATHPNYPERHEPGHQIFVNAGPVLKVNQNLRYATDSASAAVFALACEQADVPLQRYVHRADLPCGSTIGPLTAARTGFRQSTSARPSLRCTPPAN